MRACVLVLGIAVALLLAVAPGSTAPPASAQATTTVDVGDLWFCDASFENGVCATTVIAGDTVQWNFVGGTFHTTTQCAGGDLDSCPAPHLWDSGQQGTGSFAFTFETPGTYAYRCQLHPTEMRGTVTVQAVVPVEPTPTPATTVDVVPETDSGPAAEPVAVPNGGGAPPVAGAGWAAAIAFGAAALALGLLLGVRARLDS